MIAAPSIIDQRIWLTFSLHGHFSRKGGHTSLAHQGTLQSIQKPLLHPTIVWYKIKEKGI